MKPVNLNQARKTRARAEARKTADQNAAAFGRTKAERVLAAAQADQASKRLDQLKFEDE